MEKAVVEQNSGRPFFTSIYRAVLAGQPIGRREFAVRFIGSFAAFIVLLNEFPEVWREYFPLIWLTICIFQAFASYWRLRDCWKYRSTANLWWLASIVVPILWVWWVFKPSVQRGGTYAPAGYAMSVLLAIAAIGAFLQPIGSFA